MALFAAYALAIQTLFLAFTLGAHAARTSPDLHVLCLPSGETPEQSPAPVDKAHRLDCCVLGGNMLAKLFVPPPAQSVAAPLAIRAIPPAAVAETPLLSRPHSPLTARGPPLA